MMEFTMSRAVLMLCGLLLTASVAVPLTGCFSAEEGSDLEDLAEMNARMLDSCWNSGLDSMVLDGSSLLPSPEYSLSVSGYAVTVTGPSGEGCTAYTKHACGDIGMGFGETREVCRYGGGLYIAGSVTEETEEIPVMETVVGPEEPEIYDDEPPVQKPPVNSIIVSCGPRIL